MFFLFDDALQIHHVLGSQIASSFGAYRSRIFSLQPRHFGEFAVLAIAGTFLLAIVVWAYLRGPHAFREISKDMLLLILVLMFFGVFVDLTAAIKLGPVFKFASGTVENGGEMVAVSLILGYVFQLAVRNGDSDLYLHHLLRDSRNG